MFHYFVHKEFIYMYIFVEREKETVLETLLDDTLSQKPTLIDRLEILRKSR